jgi:DNA-binding transcriptional MocR family regulator
MQTAQILKDILSRIINDDNFNALIGSPIEGYSSLRNAMSKFMESRGCFCKKDEIMILSGSQQGIDLTVRVLLGPGDVVVTEEPTYMPALQVFRSVGARVISIPIDNNGMDTDLLEQVMQRYHPKLVYTMPTSHNPTGVSMSLDRRKHLIKLANHFKVLILEDDAYGELIYAGKPLPSLKSMDNSGYVIYLSTFSKIFYPGLRIGWVATHNRMIKRLAAARKAADLHTNSLSHRIIEYFISGSYYKEQLKCICATYRVKHDIMINALEKYAPLGMTWTVPKGGYYIWCRLPSGVSSIQLLAKCAEQNVSFLPGDLFFPSMQEHEYLRLNFTCVDEPDIDKGIKIICDLVTELQNKRRKSKPDSEMLPTV